MTQEEKDKIIRTHILQIKVNTFMWGFAWAGALSAGMTLIQGEGTWLTVACFAFNAAMGVHFYPFKNGFLKGEITQGGSNGKKED